MGSIWKILGLDQPDMPDTNRSKGPLDKAGEDSPKKRPPVKPQYREKKANKQGVPLPPWLNQ